MCVQNGGGQDMEIEESSEEINGTCTLKEMGPERKQKKLVKTGKQMWALDGESHWTKCSRRDNYSLSFI